MVSEDLVELVTAIRYIYIIVGNWIILDKLR